MTLLHPTERPSEQRTRSGAALVDRARVLLFAGLAGTLAAVLSCIVLCLPVLLAWFADERSTASLFQTLGVGVDVWALAHRGTVRVDGVALTLAPLLLTLVPLLAGRYAVSSVVADRTDPGGEGASVQGWRGAWRALGAAELAWFVGGYVVAGVSMVALSGLGPARTDLGSMVPGLLLVPVAATVLALLAEHRRRRHAAVDRALDWMDSRVPVWLRRAARPAGEALLGLLVVALLVVVAVLVVRAERIGLLYEALDAGWVGLVTLTVAQLALLPNLVLWVLGWIGGAGLSVGSVQVGWTEAGAGDLPLVPVLAALPEPGPLPGALAAVVVVPLLAGVWVGVRSVTGQPRLSPWWVKARVAAAACLAVGAAVLLLGWLAAGGIVPGTLGTVGTPPLTAAALLTGELLAGAVTAVSVMHLVRARRL